MQQYFTPILFDGYCPECLLKGKKIDMRLNDNDFWECELTNLQLTTFPPFAAILRWRGEGKLRSSMDVASTYYSGLIYAEASIEPGKEIFPDESALLQHTFDLEDYILRISATHKDYVDESFDANEPLFKQQQEHLEQIAMEEWENLVELFSIAKEEGLQSESFQQFHQMLYDLKIVFPFKWSKWAVGIKALEDPSTDFSRSTLLQLSMYLTVIFRSDKFNDGSIEQAFKSGLLNRVLSAQVLTTDDQQ
jgi:hypothetical protein